MRRLRFDKTEIGVLDAAMALATSQDPWAVNVVCSLEDWWKAGLSRFETYKMMVKPDWTWLSVEEADHCWDYPAYSLVILTPDTRVPTGWVWLS